MSTIKTFLTTMEQRNGPKWWNAVDRMDEAEARRHEGHVAKGHEDHEPPAPECDWRLLMKQTAD